MKTKLLHLLTFQNCAVHLGVLVFSLLIESCAVTNNMYVNDPFPLPKTDFELYGGAGMGMKPKIDSVSSSGEVFSNEIRQTLNLVFGGRYGINNIWGIGLGFHLPEVVGGVGANLKTQLSMFPTPALTNLALVADIGFVFAEDSIRILGTEWKLDDKSRGSFNIDFSMPVGYRIGNNAKLILTPRYSFNTFYLRKSYDTERSKRIRVQYPALSLGYRYRQVQVETTLLKYRDMYKLMAGVVFFIGKSNPILAPE